MDVVYIGIGIDNINLTKLMGPFVVIVLGKSGNLKIKKNTKKKLLRVCECH